MLQLFALVGQGLFFTGQFCSAERGQRRTLIPRPGLIRREGVLRGATDGAGLPLLQRSGKSQSFCAIPKAALCLQPFLPFHQLHDLYFQACPEFHPLTQALFQARNSRRAIFKLLLLAFKLSKPGIQHLHSSDRFAPRRQPELTGFQFISQTFDLFMLRCFLFFETLNFLLQFHFFFTQNFQSAVLRDLGLRFFEPQANLRCLFLLALPHRFSLL